jgi:dynein assembly factor 5, axonemal
VHDDKMESSGVVGSQVEDLCRNLTRHLNCLQDDNRNTRKRALEAIRKEVLPVDSLLDGQRGVVHTVIRPLLHVFSDPVEKCRELAINTVTDLVRTSSEPSELLQFVVPSLVQRLGQPDIVESSEELRLKLVELTTVLIDLTTTRVAPYLDDLVCYPCTLESNLQYLWNLTDVVQLVLSFNTSS